MLDDPTNGRTTKSFALQWHLTHACDLHCKHCYDRTKVSTIRLEQALEILDGYVSFCNSRGVEGSLSLSGGNPFFYRSFFELYEAAVDRGFTPTILGNPVERAQLERLASIRKPRAFQVSLEGLRDHNDAIRGEGTFDRVLGFLPILREAGVRSVVMVTLTRANMNQIIELAELLRGKVDRFTFNRLSQTGEGASLEMPAPLEYGQFMVRYLEARKTNPAVGIKDNLFNMFYHQAGLPLFRGCTGQGCGAAFNYLAILPNADVHACRKFPSRIGNALEQSLGEIYDSEAAQQYRRGCSGCDGCPIRRKCGGCLAVTAGHGLDPFRDRDPYCLMHAIEALEEDPSLVSAAEDHE